MVIRGFPRMRMGNISKLVNCLERFEGLTLDQAIAKARSKWEKQVVGV